MITRNIDYGDCLAGCIEENRLDSLLPLLFSAWPKAMLPPFRVPYPSQPLTTPLSSLGHLLGEAGAPFELTRLLRDIGRGASGIGTAALVFEGFYDIGTIGRCAVVCN